MNFESQNNSTIQHVFGERNSNVELLRIIAMFMIMMLHVNYFALGAPNAMVLAEEPLQAWGRMFFETIAIGGVNIFVLISGWFGIKFTTTRIKAYLFQCVFILLLLYIFFLCIGRIQINIIAALQNILLIDTVYGWFVLAYLFLMILSPALNIYCSTASKRQLGITIAAFFALQTVYGVFATSLHWLAAGYSPFSFIGLYLLARYMNLYGAKYYRFAGAGYILTLVIMILSMYIAVATGMIRPMGFAMSYANPFTVINALSLLIIFATRKTRHSRTINIIAKSCFAVYLVHNCNSGAIELYKSTARNIFDNYSMLAYLAVISAFMAGVFFISIIIDRLRIFVWNKVNSL